MVNKECQVTIVIPTYNRADRLPSLLDAIFEQRGLNDIGWEVIVVNNNSTDNTIDTILSYQNQKNTKIRLFNEDRQGVAYVRWQAIKKAKGSIVCFFDDDILPDLNWVSEAFKFGEQHQNAGAWGGKIHGVYESEPPKDFKQIESFFAIRERVGEPHLYDPINLSLPPGAALTVRREAWINSVPENPDLIGKSGENRRMLGDDYEFLLYMYNEGWEIWYNPLQQCSHHIPKERLVPKELIKQSKACGLCVCYLKVIANNRKKHHLVVVLKTFLGAMRRFLIKLIKIWFTEEGSIIAFCTLVFELAVMLSCFEYFRIVQQNKGWF